MLVLLVALCLLLRSAPALATDPFEGNPPGSQWGGHDFNGKSYVVGPGPEDSLECRLVTDDARITGTLYLWWGKSVEVDGHLHAYGHYVLSNDGGSWAATFESIQSTSGDKPHQNITYATGTGSGDYEGYSLTIAKHTAWGMSPVIVKGSID